MIEKELEQSFDFEADAKKKKVNRKGSTRLFLQVSMIGKYFIDVKNNAI